MNCKNKKQKGISLLSDTVSYGYCREHWRLPVIPDWASITWRISSRFPHPSFPKLVTAPGLQLLKLMPQSDTAPFNHIYEVVRPIRNPISSRRAEHLIMLGLYTSSCIPFAEFSTIIYSPCLSIRVRSHPPRLLHLCPACSYPAFRVHFISNYTRPMSQFLFSSCLERMSFGTKHLHTLE